MPYLAPSHVCFTVELAKSESIFPRAIFATTQDGLLLKHQPKNDLQRNTRQPILMCASHQPILLPYSAHHPDQICFQPYTTFQQGPDFPRSLAARPVVGRGANHS
ncbi:unnamed protein product, partial [Ectocarpus sp. 12 AP-2014]